MCKIRKMGDHHNISDKNYDEEEIGEAPELNEQEDDHIPEEYENLNSTLDQLESCLDALEQQNDSLFAKLQELLDESKEDADEEKPNDAQCTEIPSTKSGDLTNPVKTTTNNTQADSIASCSTDQAAASSPTNDSNEPMDQ